MCLGVRWVRGSVTIFENMQCLSYSFIDKGAFKYYVSAFGGVGGVSQNADTANTGYWRGGKVGA